MIGKTAAIALIFALTCAMVGCDDDKKPYTPKPPPVEETYPNTVVLYGVNHHWTAQSGSIVSDTIYFDDGEPDTLPYNSLLTLYYYGYANENDADSYTDPELEMRYQFGFWRNGISIDDGSGSAYTSPWYPLLEAEDTYCYSNLDSVTMRIGTYEYRFDARSFDDEYQADTTPDTVRFVGNYPPEIDEVQIGYDTEPLVPDVQFAAIAGDTFYIGLGRAFESRPDTVSPYHVDIDAQMTEYIFYYKIVLRASGHDDARERPGSGIRGWRYSIRGPEDYYYSGEDQWIYEYPVNEYFQELLFRIVIPYDTGEGGPDYYSVIDDPPGFLGEQELTVAAVDIHEDEQFIAGIRAVSPEFSRDDPCTQTWPGKWVQMSWNAARHARVDSLKRHFYMKLVL